MSVELGPRSIPSTVEPANWLTCALVLLGLAMLTALGGVGVDWLARVIW